MNFMKWCMTTKQVVMHFFWIFIKIIYTSCIWKRGFIFSGPLRVRNFKGSIKSFKKIEGETTVALAKSGVQVGSGSSYYIELSNAIEAELQKNLIEYKKVRAGGQSYPLILQRFHFGDQQIFN